VLSLQQQKKQKKGTRSFPSSFLTMQGTMLDTIQEFLMPLLVDDLYLVNIKVKPTNNFKIYIDADSGLSIDKCIKINRALRAKVDEAGYYPEGDYSIEVSSPGINEPLKLLRQYTKNIGRFVAVTMLTETVTEGKLLAATEEQITVEVTEGKGKKLVVKQLELPISEIKSTIVQIKF
jgi:ribosome maturation factor RimP